MLSEKKDYPLILFNWLESKRLLSWLPDKLYLHLFYRLRMKKRLNLKNPKTFNEKIQWLKLYDRKTIYTEMVDKYAVKKIIQDKIGQQYIIPTLGIWEKFEDIDFDKLPNQFVLKCTHDSGGIVICRDKNKLNINEARNKINKCLKQNYYKHGREWPYKNVKPRIIIEKYIPSEDNEGLIDYRVYCFEGEPYCIYVYQNCAENTEKKPDILSCDIYDIKWNRMPFRQHSPQSKSGMTKPSNFEKMIEISKNLSMKTHFLRVDFYMVGNRIYVGELTLSPGSGLSPFKPEKYDEILGTLISL